MSLDRLDRNVVHEICTNQVVVTLHGCVKELVENSLDAGSRRVELRLRESGSELLEVVDDGHGIAPENYEKLATRHATSKIREYDDLSQSLNTFGFRGEALAAICAMGEVTVCTRTSNDATATLLTYDRFGKLESKVPAAREVGTTVSVRELFKRIPVRHREFLRNAKAQVSSTLRLIQAYAIAQPSIRFHVLAEKMRGHGAGRSTLLSSSGTARGWSQAAAAVLGDAVISDVQPFELQSESTGWAISGLLSKVSGGRRSRDMQLFFVNRRPIDPPKRVGKLINDTFHQYNSKLWPVVILSFSASQGLVDVNVTPDKRTVFLHNEESLLTALQEALTKFYMPGGEEGSGRSSVLGDFGIKSVNPSTSAGKHGPSMASASALTLDLHAATSASQQMAAGSCDAAPSVATPIQAAEKANMDVSTTGERDAPRLDLRTGLIQPSITEPKEAQVEIATTPFGSTSDDGGFQISEISLSTDLQQGPHGGVCSDDIEYHVVELEATDSSTRQRSGQVTVTHLTLDDEKAGEDEVVTHLTLHELDEQAITADGAQSPSVDVARNQPTPSHEPMVTHLTLGDVGQGSIASCPLPATQLDEEVPSQPMSQQLVALEPATNTDMDSGYALVAADIVGDTYAASPDALVLAAPGSLAGPPTGVSTVRASVSMMNLEAAISRRRQRAAVSAQKQKTTSEPCIHFPTAFSLSSLRDGPQGHASIEEVATFGAGSSAASPETSTQPMDGSQLQFDKACFSKMRVIGQFNLGFIIAALRTQTQQDEGDGHKHDDAASATEQSGLQLFIIDQHASDEKFRFEALNLDSKIDRQPLVSPHFLQLTPAQEQLAESHYEIFKLNGFEIRRDDSRPPGRRIRLNTLPTCQGMVFGEKDVHDLLYTLEEAESHQSKPNIKDASKGSGLLDITGHRALWSSTAVPRPKKVWGLLANRACRGAIMIGKALRVNEMERVLSNLGTLQQPWNCPHGRPTMRHLIDTGAAWRAPSRRPALTEILNSLRGIMEPLPLTTA